MHSLYNRLIQIMKGKSDSETKLQIHKLQKKILISIINGKEAEYIISDFFINKLSIRIK